MFSSSLSPAVTHPLSFQANIWRLSVIAVRINCYYSPSVQSSRSLLGQQYTCAYTCINRIKCIRLAIHMHIYMHQQNKSYSFVLGQSYTYACINRIKCLAGPKGLLVIPCIQGIIGWTKVVNIYNSITEDLGHQSDQTFRGPGHKIWCIAFAPF